MRIVIIDDHPDMRDIITSELRELFPQAIIMSFEHPRNFLFHNFQDIDLVISDFSFGDSDVSFHWDRIKNYHTVIFSGSNSNIELPCPIFPKDEFDSLLKYIHSLEAFLLS